MKKYGDDEAGVNAAVPDPIGPTHKYVIKTVASTCSVKGYEEKSVASIALALRTHIRKHFYHLMQMLM